MSPAAAAKYSRDHHIDYGDKTQLERQVLGRVFPFYTFFARNTRLQAETLLKNPGKVANFAKVYNTLAQAAGFDDYQDYVKDLPDYQQRGLPIPVRVGDHILPVITAPPQTDLNQLSTDPAVQLQNLENRLSIYKLIPEILDNRSFFFQGPIQDEKRPLVPAPSFVGSLPGPVRDALGVKQFHDSKNRKVWGWPAKVDYFVRGLSAQTNLATAASKPTEDARGINGLVSLATGLTGVKVGTDKALDNKINGLYEQRTKLENKRASIQQVLGKDREGHFRKNAKTERLQREIDKLNRDIGKLRRRRGDPPEVIPLNQRPKKKDDPFDFTPSQDADPLGGAFKDESVDPLEGAFR